MFSGRIEIVKRQWLLLAVIAALAAFVIACGDDAIELKPSDGVGAQPTVISSDDEDPTTVEPLPSFGYDVVEVLAPIESVQILVLESYPEQFVVQVISGLPGGCATFNRAEVTQDGTDIRIAVYNYEPAPDQLPAISCIAIYGMHDENISLGSDFERGTTYSVHVNDHPAETFTTGSSPVPSGSLPPISDGLPRVDDPGDGFEYAPIETLAVYAAEDGRSRTVYHAEVAWGLTNGCKESELRQLVRVDDTTFEIKALVSVPTGDVVCTDNYRVESDKVQIGIVDRDLKACAVYTVNAGRESIEFQAIAPHVRCADPDEVTATPGPSTGGSSLIADSMAFELSLESKGADVENGGQTLMNELFGRFPTELKVNGSQVLIYEFAPGSSAEEASESVSSDGYSFTEMHDDGTSTAAIYEWIEPPHFYLFGNAIVLYFGTDADMVDLLDASAGKFAGPPAGTTGGDEEIGFETRLAQIESVSIASTRSIPAQHMIGVTMSLGGSCETFNSIGYDVEGTNVIVTVRTQVPTGPVACTLAIVYADESINIGSDYEAGVEYDVIVNGERQGSFIGG